MAARYRGKAIRTKDEFLRLMADPKKHEWIEVRVAGSYVSETVSELPVGLHFVPVTKTAFAQIRVLESGRRVAA